MSETTKIREHIDAHFGEHVEKLRDYLRQESISLLETHNDNVDKCARYLCRSIEAIGGKTELAQFETGYPVVFGKLMSKKKGAKTLVFYSLYDAMPVDEPEWKVDPFAAEILDAPEIGLPQEYGKCIVARCARNQKGPTMGFINALDSMLKTTGDLPVNVIFNIEGEEEIGSPHMAAFRDRYLEELKKADTVWYGNPAINETGRHVIYACGTRGLIALTLKVKGGSWGGPIERALFAPEAAWVDEPIWHLIKALDTLKDLDGKILIDGFYENVVPSTAEENALLEKAKAVMDEERLKKRLGIERFKQGKSAKELLSQYIMEPLLNIDGIQGGYTGFHIKTNLPNTVFAKMHIRLVPNMTPDEILGKLRSHLDRHGFPHVEIETLTKYPWAETPVTTDAIKAAIKAAEKQGFESIVWPRYYACCPFYVYTQPPLNLPAVSHGLGYMGNLHEANEFITIEGLRMYEKYTVDFLYEFAAT